MPLWSLSMMLLDRKLKCSVENGDDALVQNDIKKFGTGHQRCSCREIQWCFGTFHARCSYTDQQSAHAHDDSDLWRKKVTVLWSGMRNMLLCRTMVMQEHRTVATRSYMTITMLLCRMFTVLSQRMLMIFSHRIFTMHWYTTSRMPMKNDNNACVQNFHDVLFAEADRRCDQVWV